MADEPRAEPPKTSEPPDTVARGTADSTPAVAIGATALLIAVVVVLAIGVAALAYWFAG